jgi:hypothetical protein
MPPNPQASLRSMGIKVHAFFLPFFLPFFFLLPFFFPLLSIPFLLPFLSIPFLSSPLHSSPWGQAPKPPVLAALDSLDDMI